MTVYLRVPLLRTVMGLAGCLIVGCSSSEPRESAATSRRHREDAGAREVSEERRSRQPNSESTESGGPADREGSGDEAGAKRPDDAGVPEREPDPGGSAAEQLPDDTGSDHVISEPEDEARYVFDQASLRTYNFVIAEEDLAAIDLQPPAELYVNGSVEVDGESFGPLGIRYKGSVGGFLAPCTETGPGAEAGPKTGKCSIKLDFDRVDPDLQFHGLKKLNFHAMNRDKSMLRDRLGYAMFREFGIAAPRAVHARVLINGRLEGLYVVVEQVDGRFTNGRFSDGGDGNLYKEVWPVSNAPERYLAALETNEDANPSVDKMLRFQAAIQDGADASLRWFDDRYLFDYIAVDRVIANDDGAFHWYCSFNHNYYWYESQRADRLWIVPWDLDSSFQNPTSRFVHLVAPWNAPATDCSCEQGRQMPATCDPLIGQWASRPVDYDRSVDAFLEGPFSAERVDAKLAAWTEQIDPVIQEASGLNGAPTYAEWQEAFVALQAIIASSRQHRGYDYTQPPPPPPQPPPAP